MDASIFNFKSKMASLEMEGLLVPPEASRLEEMAEEMGLGAAESALSQILASRASREP